RTAAPARAHSLERSVGPSRSSGELPGGHLAPRGARRVDRGDGVGAEPPFRGAQGDLRPGMAGGAHRAEVAAGGGMSRASRRPDWPPGAAPASAHGRPKGGYSSSPLAPASLPTLQPDLHHRQPEEEQRKADEHKEDAQHHHEARKRDPEADPHDDEPRQEVFNRPFRTRFLAVTGSGP